MIFEYQTYSLILYEGGGMKNIAATLIFPLFVAGCAASQVTQLSKNTFLLDVAAAPACGSMGAARVAAKTAAIETLKAGFDRYVIVDAASQNNVSSIQLPGQYNTSGNINIYGNYGTYNSTTTYTPGPRIVAGSYDRRLMVVMLNPGERGWDQGIDARTALGPKWEDQVRKGVYTCV
jgi:hypothetical protein